MLTTTMMMMMTMLTDYDGHRRVVGVGHKLVLGNITRDSDDVFECQADNGVPPTARKTFHVTVECKHFNHQRIFSFYLFVM